MRVLSFLEQPTYNACYTPIHKAEGRESHFNQARRGAVEFHNRDTAHYTTINYNSRIRRKSLLNITSWTSQPLLPRPDLTSQAGIDPD
jgi:hypothetical protein